VSRRRFFQGVAVAGVAATLTMADAAKTYLKRSA
jgi:hypothetical protein